MEIENKEQILKRRKEIEEKMKKLSGELKEYFAKGENLQKKILEN